MTNKIIAFGHNTYVRFRIGTSFFRSPLLLLVRLYWGRQFAQSGWGKLHRVPQVTEYFASLHIPFPGVNAPFVAALEFVGGLLLLIGLFSRVTALLLAVDMIVAYLAADQEALHSIFSDPGKFYNADPYTFLFAFLFVLIFGPGRFALDYFLQSRMEHCYHLNAAHGGTRLIRSGLPDLYT
jgi:putative oxidoreductase